MPNADVQKVTWPQVGRVTEAGRYLFTFGWLSITSDDISIWQRYPNAAFSLVPARHAEIDADPVSSVENEATEQGGDTGNADTTEEYSLGVFELRNDWDISPSEK